MRLRGKCVLTGLALVTACASAVPAFADVAFGWGDNASGKLAQGGTDTTDRLTPVKLKGLPSSVAALAAGANAGYALDASGAVYAWGGNSSRQLGDGVVSTSTDFSTHAVPQQVVTLGPGSGVQAVASLNSTGMVIKSGGLYTWGWGGQGTLGNGTDTLVPVSTPSPVVGLSSGVTKISSGYSSGFAIGSGGALYSWGVNSAGQLGTGNTTLRTSPGLVPNLATGVSAVAPGQSFSLALKEGTVYAFGSNNLAQLGNGTVGSPQVPALAATVSGLPTDVTQIAAGLGHGLALSGNTLYAWGYNNYGQIGNGTTLSGNTGVSVPVVVTGIEGTIVSIGAGGVSSYAITSDGALWMWGNNAAGQLGLGDLSQRTTPTKVTSLAGYRVKSVAVGSNSTITAGFTLALADVITTTWTGTATTGNWIDPTWTDGVPNSQVVHAVLSNSVTGSTQLTLGAARSVGQLTIDSAASYTLLPGSEGSLTFNNAGEGSSLRVLSGSHSITAPVVISSAGLTVDVAQAGSTLAMTGGLSGAGSLTKTGPGKLMMNAGHTGNTSVTGGELVISSGLGSGTESLVVSGFGTTVRLSGSGVAANLGLLQVGQGSTVVVTATDRSVSGAKMLITSALTISAVSSTPTSLLDLTNNNAVIHLGSESQIRDLVRNWWNGGRRNGMGIGSSLSGVGSGADGLATLAVVLNDKGGSPWVSEMGGVSLATTDVVVKYTYLGDTDLNGRVDSEDLQNLVRGLRGGLTGWVNGDNNYDNVVDGNDLANLLLAMRLGTFSFGNEGGAPSVGGAVPEPTVAVAAIAGIFGLGLRKRRMN